MTNAKQFEERGDPWGNPSRFEATEFPDQGGPIERPYDPNFRDTPPPPSNGRFKDWRQRHRLRTVRGYTHQTIEVERQPVNLNPVHNVEPVEDTFEHQTKRWNKFIEQERAENARRRAEWLARKQD